MINLEPHFRFLFKNLSWCVDFLLTTQPLGFILLGMDNTNTAANLTAHVETLASIGGVHIDWRDRCAGRAWRKARKVRLAKITDRTRDRRYAVALHELGHVLGLNPKSRIERESAAWDWARANAKGWNVRMTTERTKSLRSYMVWALQRQARRRGRPVLPPRDSALWTLVQEAR